MTPRFTAKMRRAIIMPSAMGEVEMDGARPCGIEQGDGSNAAPFWHKIV
jgi:hypothetical protein